MNEQGFSHPSYGRKNPYHWTHDPTDVAAHRETEQHLHELNMIKSVLTAMLNTIDSQQQTIDRLYDEFSDFMDDCREEFNGQHGQS